MHVIKCTDAARRFVSRILKLLTTTKEGLLTPVSPGAQADVRWLLHFLLTFNGTTMMKPAVAQFIVEVDACLKGVGAWCQGLAYYHAPLPTYITDCQFSIAGLECFNVLLSLRMWCQLWKGSTVLLFSDNAGTVCSVNSGRAHDPLMQGVLRELWLICAMSDIDLVVRHRPGAELINADALSRINATETLSKHFMDIVSRIAEPQHFIPQVSWAPPVPI